jgi:hypothetical protein
LARIFLISRNLYSFVVAGLPRNDPIDTSAFWTWSGVGVHDSAFRMTRFVGGMSASK